MLALGWIVDKSNNIHIEKGPFFCLFLFLLSRIHFSGDHESGCCAHYDTQPRLSLRVH